MQTRGYAATSADTPLAPFAFERGTPGDRDVHASPENLEVSPFPLILGNRRIVGSLVGGIAETQEMLDRCGKHGITSDIEMITPDQINTAFERTVRGDVKYRFVIDCTRF